MFSPSLAEEKGTDECLILVRFVFAFWSGRECFSAEKFLSKLRSYEIRSALTSRELGFGLLCSSEITDFLWFFLYSLPVFFSITEDHCYIEFRAIEKWDGFSEFVPLRLHFSKCWHFMIRFAFSFYSETSPKISFNLCFLARIRNELVKLSSSSSKN